MPKKKTSQITQCQATVTDMAKGVSYSGLSKPTTAYPHSKQCPRRAVARIGQLCLCSAHVRMVKQGFVNEQGVVENAGSRRDAGRYPEKWPNGFYSWAKDLEAVALDPGKP